MMVSYAQGYSISSDLLFTHIVSCANTKRKDQTHNFCQARVQLIFTRRRCPCYIANNIHNHSIKNSSSKMVAATTYGIQHGPLSPAWKPSKQFFENAVLFFNRNLSIDFAYFQYKTLKDAVNLVCTF